MDYNNYGYGSYPSGGGYYPPYQQPFNSQHQAYSTSNNQGNDQAYGVTQQAFSGYGAYGSPKPGGQPPLPPPGSDVPPPLPPGPPPPPTQPRAVNGRQNSDFNIPLSNSFVPSGSLNQWGNNKPISYADQKKTYAQKQREISKALAKRHEEEKLIEKFPVEDIEDKGEFYCLVCRHDCETDRGYRNHIRSMIHTQRVLEAEKLPEDRKQDLGIECVNPEDKQHVKYTITFNGGPDPKNMDGCCIVECTICDCNMTGVQAYEAHMAGLRHKKNLKNREMGVPISRHGVKAPFKPRTRDSVVADKLKDCKEALLGLEFITEHQKLDPYIEPYYACFLCESKCDPRTLVSHVLGLKHRMHYMKLVYPSYHAMIKDQTQKKSEQTPIAETYARMIEAERGRQSIRLEMEPDPMAYKKLYNRENGTYNSVPGLPTCKRLYQDGESNPNKGNYGYKFSRYQPHDVGSLKALHEAVSHTVVSTEEDADMALHISKALTSALLEYRTNSKPTEVRHFLEK